MHLDQAPRRWRLRLGAAELHPLRIALRASWGEFLSTTPTATSIAGDVASAPY
jgi:hypothetical protein